MSDIAQDLGGVVRPGDLKFSDYPEATPGGMHVGLPKGVRAIHTPTGIEVACKHYRSQHLNRDACIRAIEAALTERTHSAEIAGALRDAEGWRPIESAPRDQPVIVTNGESVGEASYHESDNGWWWAGYHPTDASDGYVWQPTHWRPLPAPPTLDSAMQQGGGGGGTELG